MMKKLTLAELMLLCLTPQIEVDNAQQYVKAVCEIVNRMERLVEDDKRLIESFLEECQMWHSTKDDMWLTSAVNDLNAYLKN